MNLEKKIYLYWIKIGCSLVLKNDSRKTWKLGKKECKKKEKKKKKKIVINLSRSLILLRIITTN